MGTFLHHKEMGIPENAKRVFQGQIFSIWQWEQLMFDGSVRTFEMLSRPSYATAIGVLPDASILLVHDEQPHRPPVLTTAGGRVEEGETPEDGVKREFLEETGYKVGAVVPFFTYRPSEKMDYEVHMFIARSLEKVTGTEQSIGEKIALRTFSFDDFLRLGNTGSSDIGGPVRDWMLRTVLLEAQVDKGKRDKLYSLLYGQ